MKQSVYLGEFVLATLAGEKERGSEAALANRLVSAIRFYLDDRNSGRPGWRYPAFLPERGKVGELPLSLDVDENLWREFVEEADKQGVSVSQMASHAALYCAAEKLTPRVADDQESEGPRYV